MATITLKYNARNRVAQKTIDYILSLGVFDIEDHDTENAGGSGARKTRRAIRDVERGKVINFDSYEDYLKQTGGHA